MKLCRTALLTLISFLLVGCAAPRFVDVPPVLQLEQLSYAPQIKGNYAVFIQTGGWQIRTKESKKLGLVSSLWGTILADKGYFETMKNGLSATLQRASFVENELSPEEIKRADYDAQIILYQGNSSAEYGFQFFPSFYSSGQGVSYMTVTINVAIINKDGNLVSQSTITGEGYSPRESVSREDWEPPFRNIMIVGAQNALSDVTLKTISYLQNTLSVTHQPNPTKNPKKTTDPKGNIK